jgi:hypothetical protein
VEKNQSYSDMCKAIVAANIPWNAMEYPSSKYFLGKILQPVHSIQVNITKRLPRIYIQ